MNKVSESIIFSFFISLVMVVLDAIYHLATETAVHINYVAVKFTIIFLVVFLVAYFIGKSKTDWIFTSLAGPVIFYAYYVFANPTLNRELFRIDENFGYIFVHIAALLIAYFVFYNIWALRNGNRLARMLGYAFIISLCIFGIDSGYRLAYVQFTTHNEEIAAGVMDMQSSLIQVFLIFIVAAASYRLISNIKIRAPAIVFGSVVIIYFMGHDILRTLAAIASSLALVYLGNFYVKEAKQHRMKKQPKMKAQYKFALSALIFGIIGSIFTFVPYKTLKNVLNLGFGLRHNDHVMIGIIALIIAIVSFYRIIRTKK